MGEARTIVMAEDSRLQGMILKKPLASRGFTVHWAANGREALDLVRLHRPDLVVSDVEMPEMDGHALCRSLKADAYVTKPYDPPHVLERIDHLPAHGQAAEAATVANERLQADRARMSCSAPVLAGKPPTSSPTRA